MKLPLTVNDRAEVFDADGEMVADFWTVDQTSADGMANAEAYAAWMNAKYQEEAA